MQKGKYYEVTVVRCYWSYRMDWYPVTPGAPMHNDPELDFPWDHWHIDYRFISSEQLNAVSGSLRNEKDYRSIFGLPLMLRLVTPEPYDKPLSMIFTDPKENDNKESMERLKEYDEYLWKKTMNLQYKRHWPLFGLHWQSRKKLMNGYCYKKLDLNRRPLVCPHRGAILDGIKSQNGVITCPLHGLQWCEETGESVFTEVNSVDGCFESVSR